MKMIKVRLFWLNWLTIIFKILNSMTCKRSIVSCISEIKILLLELAIKTGLGNLLISQCVWQ